VKILEMAPEDDCEHEMFVETTWRGRKLAVPLAQVQPLESTDDKTKEAVADWQYWIARGYELS
jgi:hypothetical protein